MTLGLRIGIIVTLQTLALLVMIGMKQYTLVTGQPVVLKTAPIDPRSLFRGDYVRLNYAISRLDPTTLAGDDEFERGDDIYVVLQQGEEYWEPVSLHRRRPAAGDRRVIRGKVEYFNRSRSASRAPSAEPGQWISVKYGIENYFVPEGEGRRLERPAPGETISIRVMVDAYGNAGINAVLVNGAERYVERLL